VRVSERDELLELGRRPRESVHVPNDKCTDTTQLYRLDERLVLRAALAVGCTDVVVNEALCDLPPPRCSQSGAIGHLPLNTES
jgi:hypothetical protein